MNRYWLFFCFVGAEDRILCQDLWAYQMALLRYAVGSDEAQKMFC